MLPTEETLGLDGIVPENVDLSMSYEGSVEGTCASGQVAMTEEGLQEPRPALLGTIALYDSLPTSYSTQSMPRHRRSAPFEAWHEAEVIKFATTPQYGVLRFDSTDESAGIPQPSGTDITGLLVSGLRLRSGRSADAEARFVDTDAQEPIYDLTAKVVQSSGLLYKDDSLGTEVERALWKMDVVHRLLPITQPQASNDASEAMTRFLRAYLDAYLNAHGQLRLRLLGGRDRSITSVLGETLEFKLDKERQRRDRSAGDALPTVLHSERAFELATSDLCDHGIALNLARRSGPTSLVLGIRSGEAEAEVTFSLPDSRGRFYGRAGKIGTSADTT